MNLLSKYQLILGSKSPRRVRLLAEMGFEFQQETKYVDESFSSDLDPYKVAEYLAIKKAKAFDKIETKQLVITADTIVIYADKILGKPVDIEEARHTLKLLSNSSHDVLTGVCLKSNSKESSFSDLSKVRFAHIPDEAIEYYLEHQAPLDKAGSYGIQEFIGHNFIESIEGSYTNIMGLPTEKLFKALQNFDSANEPRT